MERTTSMKIFKMGGKVMKKLEVGTKKGIEGAKKGIDGAKQVHFLFILSFIYLLIKKRKLNILYKKMKKILILVP